MTVWTFSNPILEAMVDENRPKREANDSKQPSKASKTPKAAFSKKHYKKQWVFHYYWQQRPLKNVSRGPRCPQWFTHRNPTTKERNPKSKPKVFKFLKQNKTSKSGHQSTKQKEPENDPIFGTPFPRISGIQIMPRQKINERGEKSFLTEIILYKRKGGIRPYKALQGLIRPDKAL